jgi:enoyl-[acyl-carrier protein] reductase I
MTEQQTQTLSTAGPLLAGKKGLILGLANDKSIAWGIAEECHRHGATLAFNYLNEALQKRVVPLAQSLGSEYTYPCDVQRDEDIDSLFAAVKRDLGSIDFVVHSVAYASTDDLKGPFVNTSRDGFKLALDVSAYSLVAVTKRALPVMNPGGSLLTLSYYGAEKVLPNYRVMGVAKAALEAAVRELANDLGPRGYRINCISAGPIRTLAASGIADFRNLLSHFEGRAPMRRLVTTNDVGRSAAYLLSDMAAGVTGEIHYVDCGFNITGA